jgi:hypothetical protein
MHFDTHSIGFQGLQSEGSVRLLFHFLGDYIRKRIQQEVFWNVPVSLLSFPDFDGKQNIVIARPHQRSPVGYQDLSTGTGYGEIRTALTQL